MSRTGRVRHHRRSPPGQRGRRRGRPTPAAAQTCNRAAATAARGWCRALRLRSSASAGAISSRALAASSDMSSSTSAKPAGQVDPQRFTRRRDLGLDVAEAEQHRRHLIGRVRRHARLFDRTDDRVVVAHQPGALGPADQRVRQRNSLCPRRLGLPPRHHRVERGLRLAVGAVAAEHAAVRRTGQHDVQTCGDVAIRADVRQSADQPSARPTAAPSSPSRSAHRRRTDHRPPAAPRTGTAASASGRP